MDHFPYRILIEYSQADEAFIARVPAFEALAADGETPELAAKEARIAAEGMMLVYRDSGRPLPPPDAEAGDSSGQLRLRLPRALHARLSRIARADDVSLNQLLLSLISEGLGRTEARKAG